MSAEATEPKVEKPERKLQAEPSSTGWGGRSIARQTDLDVLTPTRMHQLLKAAESGDITAQSEMFELMEERDGELDAHLRTRKAGVSSADWTIEPADDTPNAARAAEFCTEVLAQVENLEECIFDLLDAIPKGFAVQEIEWRTGRGALGLTWFPTQLLYRPQRWFKLGPDGRTLLIRGESYGNDLEMNPSNFIVHRVRSRSGFDWRTGLMRSCVRAFIVRFYGWKDLLAFAEVFGMPARIGYLRESASMDSQEATNLHKALRDFGQDLAAIVQEGNRIELLEVANRGQHPSPEIIQMGQRELVLAILGQTLTSGGEGGGSYALGKVHNQVRWDLIESDAKTLERTMSRQLLKPIVLLNLGAAYPVPRWNIVVEEPADLAQLATTTDTLVKAGLPVGINWAYEKFGIPPPEDGEEVLIAPAPGSMPMFENRPDATRLHRPRKPVAPLASARGGDLMNDASFRRAARAGGESPAHLADLLNQDLPSYILRVPQRALAWLGERRVVDEAAWRRLSNAGKQRAWWVTGLDQGQTARLARELLEVVERGLGESAFLERLEAAGLSVAGAAEPTAGQIAAWQARLVGRNARYGAFHADNWIRMQEEREARPYATWVCADPCPICAPYCGVTAPIESFAGRAPQLHHGCNCALESVSEIEVRREGLTVAGALPSRGLEPPDWLYDRRDAYYLESAGGTPYSDAGRADAELLTTQPRVEDLI